MGNVILSKTEKNKKNTERKMQSCCFNIEKTCCFTGHRPSGLPKKASEIEILRKRTDAEISASIAMGYNCFLSGMALGFDLIAAELVLRHRSEGAFLVSVIPNLGQADKWDEVSREKYFNILNKATIVVYPSIISYSSGSYMDRNIYMADNSTRMIACYNEQHHSARSGTAATVRHANKIGVNVINLWDCWNGLYEERNRE